MKRFVLTRDMVPIHYIESDGYVRSAPFICPLPKGYQAVFTVFEEEIRKGVEEIIRDVNKRAHSMVEPFENILIEYQDRTLKEQKKLLSTFEIKHWAFDIRGLYTVSQYSASGDIYLDGDTRRNCEFMVSGFEKFFEPNKAFYCHNVDCYWQALMAREVVVRYFNLLSKYLEDVSR